MTRVLTSTGPMRKALVLSFAVHAAIYGFTRPVSARLTAPPAVIAPTAEDHWTGTTAELPFAGAPSAVYDVSVEVPPAVAPAPPAPSPAPPAPAPAPPAPAPPAPAAAVAGPEPVAVVAPPHRVPPRAAPSASAELPRPKRPSRPERTGGATVASSGDSPGAAPGRSGEGSFGAEGVASVRDLGRAFTRAIPPACDADPVWASLPTGETGKLEVAIHVDDTGHITGAEPRGNDPPRALVSLVRRTVPLLQAGTFAVREGGGEGTQILELRARISDAAASDESASGASSRLAFEYGHGRGKAGFTQASGRHVEVSVRVVRVER